MLCYGEKMLQTLQQNYEIILKKFHNILSNNLIKAGVHFILFVYWIIIILGTFLMVS